MKLNNIFYLMLCMLFTVSFTACSDDDDNTETHTDASYLVNGTFQGNVVDVNGLERATDVVVTIERFDAETAQASTIRITSVSLDMDQTATFNVAKAGDNRYTFASGSTSTATGSAIRSSGGVLDGDVLTLYLTLNSKFKFSTATAAKMYTFTCTKVASAQ